MCLMITPLFIRLLGTQWTQTRHFYRKLALNMRLTTVRVACASINHSWYLQYEFESENLPFTYCFFISPRSSHDTGYFNSNIPAINLAGLCRHYLINLRNTHWIQNVDILAVIDDKPTVIGYLGRLYINNFLSKITLYICDWKSSVCILIFHFALKQNCFRAFFIYRILSRIISERIIRINEGSLFSSVIIYFLRVRCNTPDWS
jgi:hypothetical protein